MKAGLAKTIARHRPIRLVTVTVSVSLNLFHDSGDIDRCSQASEWLFSGSAGDE